jgi:hypothetical protein
MQSIPSFTKTGMTEDMLKDAELVAKFKERMPLVLTRGSGRHCGSDGIPGERRCTSHHWCQLAGGCGLEGIQRTAASVIEFSNIASPPPLFPAEISDITTQNLNLMVRRTIIHLSPLFSSRR